jgi:hypothetical protein
MHQSGEGRAEMSPAGASVYFKGGGESLADQAADGSGSLPLSSRRFRIVAHPAMQARDPGVCRKAQRRVYFPGTRIQIVKIH